MIKATGIEFSRRASGSTNERHVGPRRQFVITPVVMKKIGDDPCDLSRVDPVGVGAARQAAMLLNYVQIYRNRNECRRVIIDVFVRVHAGYCPGSCWRAGRRTMCGG
jgi:hypothetical protein